MVPIDINKVSFFKLYIDKKIYRKINSKYRNMGVFYTFAVSSLNAKTKNEEIFGSLEGKML